jgi:hypothetical protein
MASPNLSTNPLLPRQEAGVRWHHLQPEPSGYSLQGGNVAGAPLPVGQQTHGLSRGQANRQADRRWHGDALILQVGVDRLTQTNG